jgi:hypothetical protein
MIDLSAPEKSSTFDETDFWRIPTGLEFDARVPESMSSLVRRARRLNALVSDCA